MNNNEFQLKSLKRLKQYLIVIVVMVISIQIVAFFSFKNPSILFTVLNLGIVIIIGSALFLKINRRIKELHD